MYSIKHSLEKLAIISNKDIDRYIYSSILGLITIVSVTAYLINPDSIFFVIPILITFSGIVITLRKSVDSSRNFSYFVSIMIGFLTIGSVLVIYFLTNKISIQFYY